MKTMRKKVVLILEKTETGFSAYAVPWVLFGDFSGRRCGH